MLMLAMRETGYKCVNGMHSFYFIDLWFNKRSNGKLIANYASESIFQYFTNMQQLKFKIYWNFYCVTKSLVSNHFGIFANTFFLHTLSLSPSFSFDSVQQRGRWAFTLVKLNVKSHFVVHALPMLCALSFAYEEISTISIQLFFPRKFH